MLNFLARSPYAPLSASPNGDPLCGDAAAVVVPLDAVEIPRRSVPPRRCAAVAAPAVAAPDRALPQDGLLRDAVPVKSTRVVDAVIRDGPAPAEGGEERGSVLLFAAIRHARPRVGDGNLPPQPGPSQAAPA